MSQSQSPSQLPKLPTSDESLMEVNGRPYYIKSKRTIPYLYDIDTNDEVGYWSSKKGQWILFSLYNKLMKHKYEGGGENGEKRLLSQENDDEETDTSEEEEEEQDQEYDHEETDTSEEEEEQDQEYDHEETDTSEEEEEEEQECDDEETDTSEEEEEYDHEKPVLTKVKDDYNNTMLIFTFFVFFVYLIFQKEFQSIYFDFAFIILINLLNTLKVFEYLNDE
jgi:hypothetical protein